jgi:hypothetical protein
MSFNQNKKPKTFLTINRLESLQITFYPIKAK